MKRVIFKTRVLFFLFTIIFSGCMPQKHTLTILNNPPLPSEPHDRLIAGVAKTGITPPPGMPMAGYSKLSVDARGVRTKLLARAIYIKQKDAPAVALVQCDLLSGSLALHHKVAEMISMHTDIASGGLMLSGTHSHSGPGNYFMNMMYNKAASNRGGFDIQCFDFISKQIANAVIKAYQSRKPALIATGTTMVKNVSINRSLAAYYENNNIKMNSSLPSMIEATNPYLHMIRIDTLDTDGKYKPAGVFTNFSMHNNTNPKEIGAVYNGDVFAYFERGLEWKIKHHYNSPWDIVNAAANYTHGDSNPNHSQDRVENFKDFENLGNIITEKAFLLFQSLDNSLSANVQVNYQAKEIDVFTENKIDGIEIARRPYVGMSTLSGASGRGRQTVFSKIPYLFKPGHPKRFFINGEQGTKKRIGSLIQPLIIPRKDFPHRLFLQAIRVHDTVLLPLPFEITYELGMRISDASRNKGSKTGLEGIKRYVVTGVSNGYWGYATTAEEYAIQYYEGGSTLYGPRQGEFLSAHMAHLVKRMAQFGTGECLPEKWDIHLKGKTFYDTSVLPKGVRTPELKPTFHKNKKHEEPYWYFKWYDVPPSSIKLHEDLVSVEASKDGINWRPHTKNNIPVNDSGCDISILHLDKKTRRNMTLYETRWHSPNMQEDVQYRFVIHRRNEHPVLYSESFGK